MKKSYLFILLLGFSTMSFAQNEKIVDHHLEVRIAPGSSHIVVTDTVSNIDTSSLIFSLNASLKPVRFSKNVKIREVKVNVPASDVGMDRDDAGNETGDLKLNKWLVTIKDGSKTFSVTYEGEILSALEQSKENYQRGFSESPGIISAKGIYLAGSTYWTPYIKNTLSTFRLKTTLPAGWKTVSQGKRTMEKNEDAGHTDVWVCDKPQEEVFLIAAPFTEYSFKMNNGVEAMAFLRTPDEGLANKYLEVTEQFMNMYEGLIGPYPYSKFALVENFWETGYGMPSFTLLGEKIIRFPFILYSSYPHELLHNWWGNSVYIDFSSGNWCEGLTAYMADHLIKEQRGQGENYRRSTLQKFTNFVNESNDFPLNKFISRHDAASEAVGYGKSLMMWHMIRRKLGDENFKKGFSLFYDDNKFRKASFTDIRTALEKVSGTDLGWFFNQWVNRTGAPELAIKEIRTDKYNDSYRVFLTLEQKQNAPVFDIDVPIYIATEKGVEVFVENMTDKTQEFQYTLKNKPLKLEVDPQYDVFRILDPREVPPALSKMLASKENLIILPAKASKESKDIYRAFADAWVAADHDRYEIVNDNELQSLPEDKTAWIIGFGNKFSSLVNDELKSYNSFLDNDSVKLENKVISKENKSFVITLFDPADVNREIAFIALDNKESIPGLVRKLPHYGKYSYLAFEGDEPTNIAKGQWPVFNSPLVKVFSPEGQNINVIQPRKPLAELKPVFSEKRMMEHIKYLSSDELKGRGLGTPELDKAADYIAGKFKEYGLKPMGDSYFQTFTHNFPNKGKMTLKNVIAIIPGTDPKLKDSPVVVSAHYDHLGLGWPDVHQGDQGKIHHGANDNASGVSILLELAKTMGKTTKPKRTIIFAAFTGEEAGLIGSRYFVSHIKEYFKGNVFADVNLDTDGGLFDNKLLVLNANTAREWKFIFMGTDYTTGVKSEIVQQELDASDQFAFIEKGIPAVQLFTGATPEYHRPTDTWDKIDGKGLVKVATVTKEVVEYLAEREEPMPYTGKDHSVSNTQQTKAAPGGGRKVATGSIPDFAYTGKGVMIGAIMEGSAGEKAGLKKGDIITAVDDVQVNNLQEYSAILKKYQPGDEVKLTIQRDGKEQVISLKFGAR
ncbi:MAG: M20/M25/M40 family metallo-hydrolase [Chlorobi bacterium]|nr:M20/M25/M40 family metallo-hydrolase [Chlorobiota bacterium]